MNDSWLFSPRKSYLNAIPCSLMMYLICRTLIGWPQHTWNTGPLTHRTGLLCNLEQPCITLHELEVNTLYFKDHCREFFRGHISRESGKSLASQQLCPYWRAWGHLVSSSSRESFYTERVTETRAEDLFKCGAGWKSARVDLMFLPEEQQHNSTSWSGCTARNVK